MPNRANTLRGGWHHASPELIQKLATVKSKQTYEQKFVGLFAFHRSDCTDNELIALSQKEQRILLSRDHALAHDSSLTHAYHVRANTPREQLIEILSRFDLLDSLNKRKSRPPDVP